MKNPKSKGQVDLLLFLDMLSIDIYICRDGREPSAKDVLVATENTGGSDSLVVTTKKKDPKQIFKVYYKHG